MYMQRHIYIYIYMKERQLCSARGGVVLTPPLPPFWFKRAGGSTNPLQASFQRGGFQPLPLSSFWQGKDVLFVDDTKSHVQEVGAAFVALSHESRCSLSHAVWLLLPGGPPNPVLYHILYGG